MPTTIINKLINDLKSGKVFVYNNRKGNAVYIKEIKNHKIYYNKKNTLRISDFCVTYRRYKKNGGCSTNDLRKDFPEIFGQQTGTPCNATLFCKLIEKYNTTSTLSGSGLKSDPYIIKY